MGRNPTSKISPHTGINVTSMADTIELISPPQAPDPSTSDPFGEPIAPVSLGFQILLGLANAGAIITLIPVLAVLIPAQAAQIDPINSARSIALVLALGAAGALIGNPLAGALSDRTTARMGRRRPWLLVGMAGAVVGLVMLANSRSIAVLATGWVITQFFGNVLLSGFGAVLPDRVPVVQRGATQAIIGLSSPVAVILSDILFSKVRDMRAAYYPIIAVMVFTTILFVLRYREPQLPPGRLRRFAWARSCSPSGSARVRIRVSPKFGLCGCWSGWGIRWEPAVSSSCISKMSSGTRVSIPGIRPKRRWPFCRFFK